MNDLKSKVHYTTGFAIVVLFLFAVMAAAVGSIETGHTMIVGCVILGFIYIFSE